MNMSRVSWLPFLFLALLLSAALVVINLESPLFSIGLAVVVLFALFLLNKPVYGLMLAVISIPFSGTALMDAQIAGLPGMKLSNLIVMAAAGFLFLEKKPGKLKTMDKLFIFGTLFIFTFAVLRSTAYIGDTYSLMWKEEYSTMKYLMSHLIRPLLVFIPFILIVVYVRSKEDILNVARAAMTAIVILAVTILVLYAFFIPNKLNFELVRMSFMGYLGMHGNNLADFYIAVFPLLFAYAMSRMMPLLLSGVFISLCAIGILYSRSAYLVILICIVSFFLVSARAKFLPPMIVLGAAGFAFIPPSILDRAMTGFETSDVNDISAGRVGDIWLPLLNEFMDQPYKLIAGVGRYAVMGTEAFKNGVILHVSHAHSMYLDTLFDSGVIGLSFFVIFFGIFIKRFIRTHKYIDNREILDLMLGIEISVVLFMIRGFSDSFFFPSLTNAFLWVNLGLGLSIAYLYQDKTEKGVESYESGDHSQQPEIRRS